MLEPLAVDRTRIECDLLFAPDGRRGRRLRPRRRRRPLGPGQPAGLGDLRVGAARDVVAGLHARLVRADGGRLAPTSGAGCCPGSGRDGVTRRTTSWSSASARSASSAAHAPGPARPPGARARAVRARARARGLARHVADPAAQLPHAGVRPADPGGVRRLGRRSSAGPASSWSPWSAASTCSRPTPAIPMDDYTASLADVGIAVRAARRRRDRAALAAVLAAVGDRRALPGARRDRAGRSRHRADAEAGAPRPAPSCAGPRRVLSLSDSWRPASTVELDGATCHRRPGRRVRGRLDQRGAGRPRRPRCRWRRRSSRRRTSRPRGPGSFAPHHLPLWIWMDDPSLLRLPLLRRADRQGGAGLRRAGRSTRPTRCADVRARPRDARAAGVVHGGRCCPSPVTRCGRSAASTPSRPTATSCSRRCPGHESVRRRPRRRARASSSRRRSGGSSPTWRSTGTTSTDIGAVPARPARPDRSGVPGALAGVTALTSWTWCPPSRGPPGAGGVPGGPSLAARGEAGRARRLLGPPGTSWPGPATSWWAWRRT